MENSEISMKNLEVFLESVSIKMHEYKTDQYGSWWALLKCVDGKITPLNLSLTPDVCYARLFNIETLKNEHNRLFIFMPPCDKNSNYNDFILNRSWFRDVFITKNVNNLYVEVSLKPNKTEILAAMMALRLPNERFTADRMVFDRLVEMGLLEKEAFLVYTILYYNCFIEVFSPVYYNTSNHNVVDFGYHGFYNLLAVDKYVGYDGVQRSWGETSKPDKRDEKLFYKLGELFSNRGKEFVYPFSGSVFGIETLSDGFLKSVINLVKEG